jgi:hypothetical protein
MELCELYILEQDYAKAAFCCEELILQNPHSHLYYQRQELCRLHRNLKIVSNSRIDVEQ